MKQKKFFWICLSAVASVFLLYQNFSKQQNQNSQFSLPFYQVGDRPYVHLNTQMSPAAASAGSWDGRIFISYENITPQIPISATAAVSFPVNTTILPTKSGSYTYTYTEQNGTVLNLTQSTETCIVTMTVNGNTVWTSPRPPSCTNNPVLLFGGDANLMIGGQSGGAYYSGTSCAPAQPELFLPCSPAETATLNLYSTEPYFAITNAAGTIAYYTPTSPPNTGGWNLSVFSPETLSNVSAPPTQISIRGNLSTLMTEAFSKQVPFVTTGANLPQSSYYAPYSVPTTGINLGSVAAITRAPGYDINPYPSDANGNLTVGGPYLTYQFLVYTAANSNAYVPNAIQCNDPAGQYCYSAVLGAQVIVQNPYTSSASIYKSSLTSQPTPMKDTNGNALVAFEVTSTADGQLFVFQDQHHAGHLDYSFNPNPSSNGSGWSPPNDLSYITMDRNSGLLAKNYPITRATMYDGLGNKVNYAGASPGQFVGAYPWISPDGADVFFQAVELYDIPGICSPPNCPMRVATSAVGSSTKGQVRQLDGGPNTTRSNANANGGGSFSKTGMFSFGRSPGMWSPLEFAGFKVLPLVDKPYTYPMFCNGPGIYFEASFEESLSGNYDAFLDMSEPIQYSGGYSNYVTNMAQDISGHGHTSTLGAGAMFPEEAFPSTCTPLSCPMDDPQSSSANLFSGKSSYFLDNSTIGVPATSSQGHTLLGANGQPTQATDISVSVAVMPLQDLSQLGGNQFRNIVEKDGTFSITLEANRDISVRLYVQGQSQPLAMMFNSPALPLNQWSHVAFTYQSSTGTMNVYINGVLATNSGGVASKVFGPAPIAVSPTSSVFLGPIYGTQPVSGLVYALDQFGLSRVARTAPEIMRQAGGVLPRLATPANQVIKMQALKSPTYYSQTTSPALVALGNNLFFEPRLSPDATRSCATCHTLSNNDSLAETVTLHISREARYGGIPHLLRNTPSLLDLGMDENYFRDGRADTLLTQAQVVLNNPLEMGPNFNPAVLNNITSPNYQSLFASAFPGQSSPITAANVQLALQAYEFSLTTAALNATVPFDQYMAGNLGALNSTNLLLGRDLFYGKGRCAQCHSGTGFSDNLSHAIPSLSPYNLDNVLDLGRYGATYAIDDAFKFKTPTLRNIANTSPYYHNGNITSLDNAVSLYTNLFNQYGTEQPISGNTAALDDMLLPVVLGTSQQLGLDERSALEAFVTSLTTSNPLETITNPLAGMKIPDSPSHLNFTAGSAGLSVGTIQLNDAVMNFNANGVISIQDETGATVWSLTPTTPPPKGTTPQLLMQANGDLEIVAGGQVLWTAGTGTGANVGQKFVVRNSEPYMLVYDNKGNILWSSSLNFSPLNLVSNAGNTIRFPATGNFATDGYGPFLFLIMQGDGNLVIYQGTTIGQGWTPLGATGTSGQQCTSGCTASFQNSGNLLLYNAKTLFANLTNLNPPATVPGVKMRLQSASPFIQITNPAGQTVWTGITCNNNCPK